jgi:hypothetical protein
VAWATCRIADLVTVTAGLVEARLAVVSYIAVVVKENDYAGKISLGIIVPTTQFGLSTTSCTLTSAATLHRT